jgi:hypothetical protein
MRRNVPWVLTLSSHPRASEPDLLRRSKPPNGLRQIRALTCGHQRAPRSDLDSLWYGNVEKPARCVRLLAFTTWNLNGRGTIDGSETDLLW